MLALSFIWARLCLHRNSFFRASQFLEVNVLITSAQTIKTPSPRSRSLPSATFCHTLPTPPPSKCPGGATGPLRHDDGQVGFVVEGGVAQGGGEGGSP